jgi:hypothetical protein
MGPGAIAVGQRLLLISTEEIVSLMRAVLKPVRWQVAVG